MKNSEIKTKLENYRIHRKLNRDLLISLDQDQLSLKPFGFSGTFGKQFRHLRDIERCYVESLITGALTFYRLDIDHSLETDKEKLIHELDMEDKKLEKICEIFQSQETKDESIDCSQVAKYLGKRSPGERPYSIIKRKFNGGHVYVTMVRRVRVKVMFKCLCYNLFTLMNLKKQGKIAAAI